MLGIKPGSLQAQVQSTGALNYRAIEVILLDLIFKMELKSLIKLSESILIKGDTMFGIILNSININFHP